MICPLCKTPGAYVGLKDVECVNEKCVAYSKSIAKNNSSALSREAWQKILERIKSRAKKLK